MTDIVPLRPARGEELHLLEVARQAAIEAGAVILDIYAQDFAAWKKRDASLVTEADERAESLIVTALLHAAPAIPVIAEEQVAVRGLPEPTPSRFWLVDPLDGTREFVARNGEFTVNIALVEGGAVVLGVVHVPVQNVTYSACGPGTATRQKDKTAPLPIAARRPPASNAIVLHSRSHADEAKIAAYVASLPGAERRASGSSVKFCLLASGEADYYPRFGPTMEWDTAAGHAVLDAAGGRVETLGGTCLRYGKPGFLNPDFVARGMA